MTGFTSGQQSEETHRSPSLLLSLLSYWEQSNTSHTCQSLLRNSTIVQMHEVRVGQLHAELSIRKMSGWDFLVHLRLYGSSKPSTLMWSKVASLVGVTSSLAMRLNNVSHGRLL